MKSNLRTIGPVPFPQHTGERIYMQPFTQREGLPRQINRWQPTVDAMLHGIETDGPIFLMVDQGEIEAGSTHRRGGAHIDGNWISEITAHGSAPSHGPRPRPGHGAGGGAWNCGSHGHRGKVVNGVWRSQDFSTEALILAADVGACAAFVGEVEGDPKEGGDCSHLDLSGMERIEFRGGYGYAGNVTMIHESLPLPSACKRTVVRLNVPGIEI